VKLCRRGRPRAIEGDKRAIYQRSGVPWYWIVDPMNRSLSVYRLTNDGYVLDTSVGDHVHGYVERQPRLSRICTLM
jgi:Uma2 family endonuclease